MAYLLPQVPGLLPKWLLFISLTSIGNTIQTHLTLNATSQIYNGPASPPPPSSSSAATTQSPSSSSKSKSQAAKAPTTQVTALQSRTFGTWTLLSAVVRFYAAYHTTNPQIYSLAVWTFAIAWLHFVQEWAFWGTVSWGRGSAGPFVVSTATLLWMTLQWQAYVA